MKKKVSEGMMFGFGFGLFGVLFFLMFAAFIVVFVFSMVRGVKQWHTNNNSPRLTVEALVVSRRADTTVHHDDANHVTHHSTDYYATFEVESGDRIELRVGGSEYGLLAEGDRGKLTLQGTRYLGFKRT